MKNKDVVALGELLIDFTENGKSEQESIFHSLICQHRYLFHRQICALHSEEREGY